MVVVAVILLKLVLEQTHVALLSQRKEMLETGFRSRETLDSKWM